MKVITARNNSERNQCLKKRKEEANAKNRNAVNKKNIKHEDHLDVSYPNRAPSLDRARKEDVAQPGASMCDPNAMLQAQQQILYLPPNYLSLPMNVRGEEAMEVPGPSTMVGVIKRPASAGNPEYISLLKQDMAIGQPVGNHCGQRDKWHKPCWEF
uniref:Uncharacterized protein n=1 Tax=Romanomermis culicivorax TaxID=13658 RepID=A0A915L5K8_ROMCU